jgi:macrodomain Ter protein organizer (MatP/YcbG family)
LSTYAILYYIKCRYNEKHSDFDELNEDLLTLLRNTNELHQLLETSYTHEQKIDFDILIIQRALDDESNQNANRDVITNLIKDNENLSNSFKQIIQLRDSLNSLNFL